MTELEKHIYDSVKDVIPHHEKKMQNLEGLQGEFVKLPFMCDGVLDFLVFSVKENRFTHIDYHVGVGKGVGFGLTKFAAYFDESQRKQFEI